MMAQGCKDLPGLITLVGVWLTVAGAVPVDVGLVGPVLLEVVLVGSSVLPGTEVVADAPTVDVPRPEVFRVVPGVILLVAESVDPLSGEVVKETRVVGLVPVVLVPRKQVMEDGTFVMEIITGELGVEQRGLSLTCLCCW